MDDLGKNGSESFAEAQRWLGSSWQASQDGSSNKPCLETLHQNSATFCSSRGYSQLEDGRPLAQHHGHEILVRDGFTDAPGDFGDHFLQLQVGLGRPQFLHHPFHRHEICEERQAGRGRLRPAEGDAN